MRSVFPDLVEKGRLTPHGYASNRGDAFGMFLLNSPFSGVTKLKIIACGGDEKSWLESKLPLPAFDHVSVSVLIYGEQASRCPTWEEMDFVKDLFFHEDETVVQFHPPKSVKVNRHNYCLHLWKVIGDTYKLPPQCAV